MKTGEKSVIVNGSFEILSVKVPEKWKPVIISMKPKRIRTTNNTHKTELIDLLKYDLFLKKWYETDKIRKQNKWKIQLLNSKIL